MNRTCYISAALIAVSLLAMATSTAEAARASKPKEIVVVGSKLMETHSSHFLQMADHVLAVWTPRIEFLRDMGRDDLAETTYLRVSERLRHKSRAAMAHVNQVLWHSLKQLAQHGGTLTHEQAIRDAADTSNRNIQNEERRVIAILASL
jgi:hypothetical protein